MQKAKDLRDKTEKELMQIIKDSSKELYELRNELSMSRKVDKPHRIKDLRRDKARILTVLNEKRGNSKEL